MVEIQLDDFEVQVERLNAPAEEVETLIPRAQANLLAPREKRGEELDRELEELVAAIRALPVLLADGEIWPFELLVERTLEATPPRSSTRSHRRTSTRPFHFARSARFRS